MKEFKLLLLFTLLLSSLAHAARVPSRWRFEFNYGKSTIQYKEEQDSVLFTNRDIEMESEVTEFTFQYFLKPPWLDLTFGLQTAGFSADTPTDPAEQFKYVHGYANLGWVLPSINDFWMIKLVFQGFYTTTIVENDAFGFKNLFGGQIYPEIEYLPFGSDLFLQISPFIKLPLYTADDKRSETTIGLKIKIPLNGNERNARFPVYAYQKAIMIRAYYSKIDLRFEKEGFIPSEIEVEQVAVTLGFNF